MHKTSFIAFLILTSAYFIHASIQKETAAEDLVEKAKAFVGLLSEGKYAQAVEYFDATMTKVMPEDKLKATWETVLRQAGVFKSQDGTRTGKAAAYDIVFVKCLFEKSALDTRIVFDKEGKIAGLFFQPSQEEYKPPTYANPAHFDEKEVTVGSGEWVLPGTLALPKGEGPFPALVLVHGSGPNDRDESVGACKPFRDLAWGLASRGIAVLRYDKRTKTYGKKMAALTEDLTVKEETIDDALEAANLLRQTKGIDVQKIFVLGHSLGGMLVPRIGLRDPEIAGFIIMAGPTRPLEDLMVEQTTYISWLDGSLSDQERTNLEEIKKGVQKIKDLKKVDAGTAGDRILGARPGYWLDLQGYNPAESAKGLSHPLLILQGERDYQVRTTDFEGWKSALASRADVEFKLYPLANHLFIEGKGPSHPNEYLKAGNIAESVVDDIALWIKKQLEKRTAAHETAGSFEPAEIEYGILLAFPAAARQEKNKPKKDKVRRITEEIVVEAKSPGDIPLATTSVISAERVVSISPRDLSDVLSYTSGTLVTAGAKNEYRLMIRGLDSPRIALLVDGIPVYEPFFNSFDLKTIPAGDIEAVKIVKGASSVLYGPNTMGGIVNVITRRPDPPSGSLNMQYDDHGTFSLTGSSAARWGRFLLSGFALWEQSDGFRYRDGGMTLDRDNSDAERWQAAGKIYYYPASGGEILLEASYYTAEYGIPWALEYFRPRYWRFKDWNRSQISLGGTFSLGEEGTLKARSYYVRHDNVLDAFDTADMRRLDWESTYENDTAGAFVLGSFPWGAWNDIQLSLNVRLDTSRTQDNIGTAWERFSHRTLSIGVEDHIRLSPKWTLSGGLSLDHLDKENGRNKTAYNPLAGIRFQPRPSLGLHLTLAQKSRFPSMKALYSSSTGNPDLGDERVSTAELGFLWQGGVELSGALFYSSIRDLIQSIRLSDGSRTNINVGRARIVGGEVELRKNFGRAAAVINWTYLDGLNRDDDRPLDLVPKSQLNFTLYGMVGSGIRATAWGLYVSGSEVLLFDEPVEIPDYFVLNGTLTKSFSRLEIFLKAENILDASYVTEPGFPMRSRTVSLGLRFEVKPGHE